MGMILMDLSPETLTLLILLSVSRVCSVGTCCSTKEFYQTHWKHTVDPERLVGGWVLKVVQNLLHGGAGYIYI